MPLRSLFALLLALAVHPAHASEPASADIDRLLKVMQVEKQMAEMEQQMSQAQQAAIVAAVGKDASAEDLASMQGFMARNRAKISERMAWPALAPMIRKVYAQVYTPQEVEAMIAFYGSPVGAEILRKAPTVAVRLMEEMHPLMQDMLSEMQGQDSRSVRPKP